MAFKIFGFDFFWSDRLFGFWFFNIEGMSGEGRSLLELYYADGELFFDLFWIRIVNYVFPDFSDRTGVK